MVLPEDWWAHLKDGLWGPRAPQRLNGGISETMLLEVPRVPLDLTLLWCWTMVQQIGKKVPTSLHPCPSVRTQRPWQLHLCRRIVRVLDGE